MSIKSFQVDSAARRIVLIIAGLGWLIFLAFAVKWYFGNAIAERAVQQPVAELALDLAPDDPQAHYALALAEEKVFAPENLQKSLVEYERVAALSPNDYRSWLELGKARERGGDAAGAEPALRKSLELAPNYAVVQWTLGNMLLRRGKTAEGFTEIRLAAESDEKYAAPMVSIAGQIFDGDLTQIRKSVGNLPQMNFALVTFLAGQKRFDEALEIWNGLPTVDKKSVFKDSGQQFFAQMLAAGKYRNAVQIQNQIADASEKNVVVGQIYNGDFEAALNPVKPGVFEWQIADGSSPQIGFDEQEKHSGARSLVIIFNSLDGREFRQISQITAVESTKKYAFEFFYKSALKTASTLKWEIVDISDGKILATTNALAADTDWTNPITEFTTAETTQAIVIRLARADCQSSICPIAGKVWFDDFRLISR